MAIWNCLLRLPYNNKGSSKFTLVINKKFLWVGMRFVICPSKKRLL